MVTVTILSPSILRELDECHYIPGLTENADVASRKRKRKGSIHTPTVTPQGLHTPHLPQGTRTRQLRLPIVVRSFLNQAFEREFWSSIKGLIFSIWTPLAERSGFFQDPSHSLEGIMVEAAASPMPNH